MIAFSQQPISGASDPGATARGADAARTAAVDRLIVVFRNDDPSAASEVAHERRINELFERYGVPQTIGVIPNCTTGDRHDPRPCGERPLDENPAMVAELRRHCAAVGSEIALHGYTHRTSPRSMPRRREYFEFRDESAAVQAEKLAAGFAIIERALGVRPVTFIPPWNRMDTATARACQQTGLTIASSGVYTPVVDGVVGLGTDCDLFNFPEFFERALRSERRVFLRILFHSRTTRTVEEIAALERALQLVTQTPGCKAMTLARAVERYRDEIRVVNDASRNVAPQDTIQSNDRGVADACRRVFRKIGWRDPMSGLLDQVESAYRDGCYREVVTLSSRIDTAGVVICFVWFLLSTCIGSLIGLVLGFAFRCTAPQYYVYLLGLASLLVFVMALLLRHRATAATTRLFLLMTSGWFLGGLLFGALGLPSLLGLMS